jgi:hypothetical protein
MAEIKADDIYLPTQPKDDIFHLYWGEVNLVESASVY